MENNAQWSDWNEHGGRWSDLVDGGVLRYSDNPEKFREIIDKVLTTRKTTMRELLDDIGELTINEIVTNPKYDFMKQAEMVRRNPEMSQEDKNKSMKDSLGLWRALKALELANGHFVSDSHFYDIESSSDETKYLWERCEQTPNEQWLVVWDLHH